MMIGALLLVVASAAPGAAAWRSALWGMTEAEVLAAFPGEARRMAAASDFHGGIAATVEIPRLEISRLPFRVQFGFKGGALVLVNLQADDRALTSPEVQFRALRDSLTEKYGRPLTESREILGPGATWKSETATIRLQLLQLSGTPAILAIVYSPLRSSDSEKL